MFKKTIPLIAAVAVALSPIVIIAPVQAEMNSPKSNHFWWPEQLDLTPLRVHDIESDPYGTSFTYAGAFNALDLADVKSDIEKVLTDSQDWWPADYGTYAPFFIRMAWHAAGTYRVHDGRGGAGGGQQRFDPLNSWPDNASLDKARRLLWPLKQKYGRSISWADLIALTGNVALESMGFKTFGYAGGREDDWEPDLVYWGPETEMLTDERRDRKGKLKGPLAAVEMGLIYVNPEGPHGNPDPIAAAHDIRLSFGRMAMNDEEIVALIAGGHTFGKAHGAHKVKECLEAEPAAAPLEQQGLGWKNKCGKGHSEDTITSGLEGAWTVTPTKWSTNYLDNLMAFNWVTTKSPAGATQWVPDTDAASNMVPDAHIPGKRHKPIMFTTDIALKKDPEFLAIVERFRADPAEYELAFAKAWFKLNHRDLGPRARYLGSEIPKEVLKWQDPVPEATSPLVNDSDITTLKNEILNSGLTIRQLVRTAWASAASFRATDMRGGANGSRVRLSPQVDWEVNSPDELKPTIDRLAHIQSSFNDNSPRDISLADIIVLGGATAIESAASKAGKTVTVPFVPGRTDATQDMTDVESFGYLEPVADAFRNYYDAERNYMSPAEAMVERAALLDLSVPQMSVLLGGMRVLDTNHNDAQHGVFTTRPGTLTNDFFVNLLDMRYQWTKSEKEKGVYVATDRQSKEQVWSATPVDLIFGSNSELRSIAEVYAMADADQKFVDDFVAAWAKVMQNDRFDLKHAL
ncbi:MAG: catalase/peroxidase HPI [Alteromonas sp.]|jgi:catalase-peroxidase|uniref:catalase/peroxidase HPI n=1 Tax=Alteromonas sp. TaxID=232 RepID=UPI000B711F46|nr:catalase/peroxidase HPI [Alteromonas sp.]MAI37687.1 catalase/peroxidase HPI [Alteromonas sp.]OUX87556.1 MAG: catalase/peroxidase HPI [Alteromonas sp. TMED35]|tara:strand:+ start:5759 stop:7993 length:2235 start_codon:yes stop_codon:yes gene_type:complete